MSSYRPTRGDHREPTRSFRHEPARGCKHGLALNGRAWRH